MAQQTISAPLNPVTEAERSVKTQAMIDVMQQLDAASDTQASWDALTAAQRNEAVRMAIKAVVKLYRREWIRR